MIGWAASPTTTSSAKFMSMKRKISAVMPHAPLSGRSCPVTCSYLYARWIGLMSMRQERRPGRKDGAFAFSRSPAGRLHRGCRNGVPRQRLAIDFGADEQHGEDA